MFEKLLMNVRKNHIPDHQRETVDNWVHNKNKVTMFRLLTLIYSIDIMLYFLLSFFDLLVVKNSYFVVMPAIIGGLFVLSVYARFYYMRFPVILGYLSVGAIVCSRVIYLLFWANSINAFFVLIGTFAFIAYMYIGYNEMFASAIISLSIIAFLIGLGDEFRLNDYFLYFLVILVIIGHVFFSKLRFINVVENFLRINEIERINSKLAELNANYEKELNQNNKLLKKAKEAETMFRQLTEMVNSSVIMVDHNDKIIYMNSVFKSILKNNSVRMMEDLKELFKPLCFGKMMDTYTRVKNNRMEGFVHNINCLTHNNSDIWFDMKLTPIDMENVHHILISGIDITELKEKEISLERLSKAKDVVLSINHAATKQLEINDYFKYVLNSIQMILPHGKMGSIMLYDDGVMTIEEAIGYNHDRLKGFKLNFKDSYFYRHTGGRIESTEIINNIQYILKPELNYLRQNEEGLIVESSIGAPIIIDGNFYGLISFESEENFIFDDYDKDIMDYIREQVGLAIKNMSLYKKNLSLLKYDQLTGFFNRWYIEDVIDKLINQWQRSNQNILFCVMEINYLKEVNDRLEYLNGDLFIKTFAEQIVETFRSSDIFIRMHGDEFLGIMYEISKEDLLMKLENLNKRLLATTEIEAMNLKFSFSIGLSEFGNDGETFKELLKIAYQNMYKYKKTIKEKGGPL